MKNIVWVIIVFCTLPLTSANGAYHHGGDTDSDEALQVYPAIEGTKLDSCALCHTGGEYEKKPGVSVTMGSCQWCHYVSDYNQDADFSETLNTYGEDYKINGRNSEALTAIESLDSDGDGFSNIVEINALHFPGDAADDPTKVPAPYMVISRDELEKDFPYHEQTMLMNTHKSGDFYATYGGVPVADLLDAAGILDSATGITVFAPDGWEQYHPLDEDSDDPLMYHVYGAYPQALFYYEERADVALQGEDGWCDYSAPGVENLNAYEAIVVENGLQMILAYLRNDEYLDSGVLTIENKLDGEGPFRLVPPQKTPCPPDQASNDDDNADFWHFDNDLDHNAGFSTRTATIIRVEPLPEGTTDIDTKEAGWNYVDESKIIIYGALNPLNTILTKLAEASQLVRSMDSSDFRSKPHKSTLLKRIMAISKSLEKGHDQAATHQLESLSWKIDGCAAAGQPDHNDWIRACDSQSEIYWLIHEVRVLHGDM